MTTHDIQLFALDGSRAFGQSLAKTLEIALAPHEERSFEDGEHKIRPLAQVRGKAVHIVHSLYGEPGTAPDEKLCRLLFLAGAARDHGARSVTLLTPYLCFARKDRRTKPFDPVTLRSVAQIIESVGVDRVVTLDVHNPAAFENAFRIPAETLDPAPLFAKHLRRKLQGQRIVVLSPDPGGVKRAEALAETLSSELRTEVGRAFMDKKRSVGVVTGDTLVGSVSGAVVLVVDDIVATGGTLRRAADQARRAGAVCVMALASHGLFIGGGADLAGPHGFDEVLITDSVPPFRINDRMLRERLTVLEAAPLFADAMHPR